jgi:hypothetical protein
MVVSTVGPFTVIAGKQFVKVKKWLDEFHCHYLLYFSCWFHFSAFAAKAI